MPFEIKEVLSLLLLQEMRVLSTMHQILLQMLLSGTYGDNKQVAFSLTKDPINFRIIVEDQNVEKAMVRVRD